MKKNKKIRIIDEMKTPIMTMREQFSTELTCLNAIFKVRAMKEQCGCLGCGGNIIELYRPKKGRRSFQCSRCFYQVSPLVGTVLERTHVQLVIWFEIIFNKLIHHSGFSANKAAYLYSLSDETVSKLFRRVRKWMNEANSIGGDDKYEIDEVAIPTGNKGLLRQLKKKRGFGSDSYSPCLTIMSRSGKVKSFMINDRDEETILPIILDNVPVNSTIYTDEFKSYNKLTSLGYKHKTVNHSKHQYKNEDACTNRVEGFFGLTKPNIRGTYRNISKKYSQDYMNEHGFRYNNCQESLENRFQKLLDCLPPLYDHIRNSKKSNPSNLN